MVKCKSKFHFVKLNSTAFNYLKNKFQNSLTTTIFNYFLSNIYIIVTEMVFYTWFLGTNNLEWKISVFLQRQIPPL